MAWPVAIPRAGFASSAVRRAPSSRTRAGNVSPCARSCTSQSTVAGAPAVQTGRSATMDETSSASAGPTVTVLVSGGHPQVEPPALADRVGVGTLVAADDLAGGGVDDVARGLAQLAGEEPLGIAVGDEADVVAVGLVGHRQIALGSLGPHGGLGR